MAEVPDGLKYTKEHEWARAEGRRVTVGITRHAVDELGDVTLVSIDKKVGDALTAGAAFGVVESVKAVSDLYAPLAGTLVEINTALNDAPEALNDDPYAAWMVFIEAHEGTDPLAGLLDADAYRALLGAS